MHFATLFTYFHVTGSKKDTHELSVSKDNQIFGYNFPACTNMGNMHSGTNTNGSPFKCNVSRLQKQPSCDLMNINPQNHFSLGTYAEEGMSMINPLRISRNTTALIHENTPGSGIQSYRHNHSQLCSARNDTGEISIRECEDALSSCKQLNLTTF